MASQTEICNKALLLIGEKRIVNINDNLQRARDVKAAYNTSLAAELRKHTWNFSKGRAVLSPDADAPEFEFDFQFSLPADFLKVIKDPNERHDWTIEGRKLLTSESDVLELRYVRLVTDTTQFDALFVEAFASRLAQQIAITVTHSATQKQIADAQYREDIGEARKADAFEKPPQDLQEDSWEAARR